MNQKYGAKCYLYTRVSTAIQVDGYSLEAQKTRLLERAKYEHMEVAGEYTDAGASGKNTQGRPAFTQMMQDIQAQKDNVAYVLVFKLSRFGRNAADVLSSLQTMQDYGVNLICVEDNIDSSADSGKLIIAVMSAMAEIERENISVQSMAGRKQKAKEGGWNGGQAPYGYTLKEGRLVIEPSEAEIIQLIFDKFVYTELGGNGVAGWLNTHGYNKATRKNGTLSQFSSSFVKGVLDNPVYMGKIAYGRRGSEKIPGKRNEYHVVKQSDYDVYDGQHEAIITEELWNMAHAKRMETGNKPEKLEKEHNYILGGLLRCPACGGPMYGNANRSKKKKDGSDSIYYYYMCRHKSMVDGHTCSYSHQWGAKKIDKAVRDVIVSLVNTPEFEEAIKAKIGEQLNTEELVTELETYQKEYHQAEGREKKLSDQMDSLDVDDRNYERRYRNLQERLDSVFDELNDLQAKIGDVKKRIQAVEDAKLTRDGIYRYLLEFERIYDKMTDYEKQQMMRLFIERIEIFPEKQEDGRILKHIQLKFPVSYNGMETDSINFPSLDKSCGDGCFTFQGKCRLAADQG